MGKGPCHAVQIITGFHRNLAEISHDRFPDKWVTTPKTVELGFLTSDFAKPTPAVLLSFVEERPFVGSMITNVITNEVEVDIQAVLISRVDRAATELLELRGDILDRLAMDMNLRGGGDAPLLYQLQYAGGRLATDAMEHVAGYAVFQMLFRGQHAWQQGSP